MTQFDPLIFINSRPANKGCLFYAYETKNQSQIYNVNICFITLVKWSDWIDITLPESSGGGCARNWRSSLTFFCTSSLPNVVFKTSTSWPLYHRIGIKQSTLSQEIYIAHQELYWTYATTARTGSSVEGFQATSWMASPISKTLRHLPVSTSHILTVPSVEPLHGEHRMSKISIIYIYMD